MLKHVCIAWENSSDEYFHSLVAVKVSRHYLTMRTIHGKAIGIDLLLPVLSAALPENWIEEAEGFHQSRKNPWLVKIRQGRSGCRDYILYLLRDSKYMDQSRSSSIHISMAGRLNEEISMWLGDVPPLLAAILKNYPPANEGDYSIEVYDPALKGEYLEAGEESGLRSVIESLKTVEVLAK